MDYFRTDCVKSYFEIVALVNKGNKFVNEQTEAKFFITGENLFLGIDHSQKLHLCRKTNHWYPAGSFRHQSLEELICGVLNKYKIISGDVNQLIKTELFKLPD
ncbi:MAG: hypothetical protein NDI63_12095 [Pseudobdellovibrio sp.]|nr:hypothetical protein [Pseudobdellovibrio sp.]